MFSRKASSKGRLIKSNNKWGRSKRRHLRAKTTEKRHRINMRRNSKTYNSVSTVQINGSLVLPATPGVRDGTRYPRPG